MKNEVPWVMRRKLLVPAAARLPSESHHEPSRKVTVTVPGVRVPVNR